MQKFVSNHWQTILITLAAIVILIIEYRATPDNYRWQAITFQNPFLVAMGKWGIRFLLISLAITPLNMLTHWRFILRFRKPAGLLAFAFVSIHVLIYLVGRLGNAYSSESEFIDLLISPIYVLWGVIAYVILLMMALTSFQVMMKKMGRDWKRLHRLVYAAGILMMIHSITAALNGKRQIFGGEESARELAVYGGILSVLLVMRVPLVKNAIQRLVRGQARNRANVSATT